MPASILDRIPGGYGLMAAALAARRQLTAPISALASWGSGAEGLAAHPRDLRPADPENGRRILAGVFLFGGESLAHGVQGDPWDRTSPSRRFAVALHRFGWLRDLVGLDPAGSREGLRLTLGWRWVFAGGSAFAWNVEVLERRVFNLACAARAICVGASDAETALIASDLARQARALLAADAGPARAAERAVAAAVAGAALGGAALLRTALRRLDRALPQAVDPDGGLASRSPQAALELLFDLLTLDDALTQRGVAASSEMSRALDRLARAVRFFTLADGDLAAFQGGGAVGGAYVAAARAQDLAGEGPPLVRCNGYHRLDGRALQVVADAAGPAAGAWSVTACAQPLAIEVLAAGRRLFGGAGWTADGPGPQALRLIDAASTLALADQACGAPIAGFAAQVLGPRLRQGPAAVEARRQDGSGALLLELSHDGWAGRFGLRHERRLYLDAMTDELRGEDRLTPLKLDGSPQRRRFVAFSVRFHLHPQVSALVAQDRRSVLFKVEGAGAGWTLRTDAHEIGLEPSVHQQGGVARRSQQIVLRGQARLDAGAKVRWKLSAVATRVDGEDPAA